MSEAARRLNRTVSEIFRMILCLEQRGYLAQSPNKERYHLTLRLFRLARGRPPTKRLVTEALRDHALALPVELRQSCHLGIIDGGHVVILAQVDSPESTGFYGKSAKFDENYHIVGKGNGIPDIIDEAEWGAHVLGVHAGTLGRHSLGHRDAGVFSVHHLRQGDQTLRHRGARCASAGFAAGMFMHLARIIKPYKPDRAEQLQKHAEMAMSAAGPSARPSHRLYFAVQKYLLTGDDAAHRIVKDLSASTSAYASTFNGPPESFAGGGWLASFFSSYIIEKNRPTDPEVVARFKEAIKAAADKEIGYLNANAYPVGTPPGLRWWGSNTAQGQYAYPCLLQWALTKDQKYIDAVSQLMDYNQGLNPIGKCYVCGIGFNRVHNPHDRESAFTKSKGWGPRPGVLVFGPRRIGRGVSVPDVRKLPRERRYIDNLGSIQWNEFTVYQSLCFPAAVYPVLSQGGKWDEASDPFAVRSR